MPISALKGRPTNIGLTAYPEMTMGHSSSQVWTMHNPVRPGVWWETYSSLPLRAGLLTSIQLWILVLGLSASPSQLHSEVNLTHPRICPVNCQEPLPGPRGRHSHLCSLMDRPLKCNLFKNFSFLESYHEKIQPSTQSPTEKPEQAHSLFSLIVITSRWTQISYGSEVFLKNVPFVRLCCHCSSAHPGIMSPRNSCHSLLVVSTYIPTASAEVFINWFFEFIK